ncbi:MAG TPA: MBL fold metallo-hydrolase [Candidatus Binatia bacterium]|nr:MBL fold metallo-hydrolase [Candidatus Binatia bacterium]
MALARMTILGSGSNGNCTYLETEETRLLIDAGLSGRQVRQRMLTIGRAPEDLDGILITHEHTDHINGLVVLAAKLGIPVYCNRLTREAIEATTESPMSFHIFETGSRFAVGDVEVETFSVPHDAYDPVGFLIHTHAGRIGFLTDLGYATKLIIQRVRTANVLLLETNHDLKLLQDNPHRPWSVKQRILSRHGHLSNDAAADLAEQIVSADLNRVYLGHLSSDCNRPQLAHDTLARRMERVGATHVHIEAAAQDVPSAPFALDPTCRGQQEFQLKG